VSPYGIGRGAYCYNVINKDDKGCEKSYTICEKGYYCEDNTCVLDPNFKVDKKSKDKVVSSEKEEEPSENKTTNKQFLVTLSLYILLGLIVLIVVGLLMYNIARNFN
jgi:hypothetical protein